MCPRREPRRQPLRVVLAAAFSLVVIATAGARGASDQPGIAAVQHVALERYLETSGLDALLIVHLQRTLDDPESADRTAALRSMLRAYLRRLQTATDPAELAQLEQEATKLISKLTEHDGLELKLTLSRSAYERAEKQAELRRLRILSDADAEEIRREFNELAGAFGEIASAAERRADALERQEEAAGLAGGSDPEMLTEALNESRRLRSMAHYLAGWSCYYAAELNADGAGSGAPEQLERAERHFGWLLNAKPGASPELERVPDQLLGYEHVARAVLGVSLCWSLRPGGGEAAARWLDQISVDVAPAAVREQLSARRLIVLARAQRWPEVSALVAPETPYGRELASSPTDARLLGVLTLEARESGQKHAELQPLIMTALHALAEQGQPAHVLDLASKYLQRTEDLVTGTFLPDYVRGLREYERARKAHGPQSDGADHNSPSRDPAARRAYSAASQFFMGALSASDARSFGAALRGVALLRALSTFYAAETAEELRAAALQFGEVGSLKAEPGAPEERARAELFAIRALELAIERTSGPKKDLVSRRDALIQRFLNDHPQHLAAARLLYDRAVSAGRSGSDAARDLLSIPADSPLAGPARQQAARLLYQAVKDAAPAQKQAASESFLAVAVPLLDEARRAVATDVTAATRAELNARRVLDVALALSAPDLVVAQRALDLLSNLESRGLIDDPVTRSELLYRRLQYAALLPDWARVEQLLTEITAADPRLARAAERFAYQRAVDRWPLTANDQRARDLLAELVISLGQRVMRGLDPAAEPISSAPVATLYAAVAQAATHRWLRAQDRDSLQMALSMYKQLVAAHPRDAGFLRASAVLADSAQDSAAALEAYRALSAGLTQGTQEWFAARTRFIELLVQSDPTRAEEVLKQHMALYTDLGPPPWNDRLRAQLEALARRAATGAPPTSGGRP